MVRMGNKSRETIYGASARAAAERVTEPRKAADRLGCEAWNARMLSFQGPAQPSPALGHALSPGYSHLQVKCLGCESHPTVALDIVRRYPYERSCLVALRATKISTDDPRSTW
jgi:hypothetical protein